MDKLPSEVKCFICLRPVDIDDEPNILQVNAPDCSYAVILCEADFDWAEANEDAALVLVKGRILAAAKQKEQERKKDEDKPWWQF